MRLGGVDCGEVPEAGEAREKGAGDGAERGCGCAVEGVDEAEE